MTRERPGARWRRTPALLASGLVLGVGAGATLAAWNDSEFTTAQLTAAVFGIQAASPGGTPSDHPSSAPLVLEFDGGQGMLPGQTVYAAHTLHPEEDSVPASVTVLPSSQNSAGLGASLSYGVSLTPGAECNATTFAQGEIVVPAGTAVTAGSPGPFALASSRTVCTAVELSADAPNDVQGQPANLAWELRASPQGD